MRKNDLQPLGRIVDSEWAGLDPAHMGLGPVHAATPILDAILDLETSITGRSTRRSPRRCSAASRRGGRKILQEELGLGGALGGIDEERLNVDGGAIALGHPVGARARASSCIS